MKVPIDFSSHLRAVYLSEQQKLKNKIINYSWFKFFKTFVLKKINFVRVLNKKIYKDLIELKYPMDCILEIPNGITSKKFIGIKKIQNPNTHFGYVGRLTKFKNVKFLLDVFKEYLKKFPSDKLFIYGTGADENFILNFIEENNLSNNIVLMGFEKDKTKIYSNLEVLIDPATAQGISNSNLEAMCSKTFVIASEVDGNKELIEHGKTGFLFELNSGEDLLNNLLFYKEHPKTVQEILNKANLEIINKYDIDVVVAKQIIEFLKLKLGL